MTTRWIGTQFLGQKWRVGKYHQLGEEGIERRGDWGEGIGTGWGRGLDRISWQGIGHDYRGTCSTDKLAFFQCLLSNRTLLSAEVTF